ncbi:helix-turn-helix transcriptional regulator [Priestia flexa]|nr:helix-turn-helix transcriptional regulator [Priestia flexa]
MPLDLIPNIIYMKKEVVLMLEIAVKIKMLRANAGLTQDQFAKLLNISRSKVSKWETSIQYPDIADCLLLKSHFKINLDEFLESTPRLKQPHKLNSSPATYHVYDSDVHTLLILFQKYPDLKKALQKLHALPEGPQKELLNTITPLFRYLYTLSNKKQT